MDADGRRRLGRMRIELQCVRPGLSDRSDPSPAAGGEKSRANGSGDRQREHLFTVCRSRSMRFVRPRVQRRRLQRDRIHSSRHGGRWRRRTDRRQRISRPSRAPRQVRRLWTLPDTLLRDQCKERAVLDQSAIMIAAGEGREDRMMSGSYRDLHKPDAQPSPTSRTNQPTIGDFAPTGSTVDPFGVESESVNDTN